MRAIRILLGTSRVALRYGPAVALFASVLWIVLRAVVWGPPPAPIAPPAGWTSESTRVDLHWSRGAAKGIFRLEVAADGDFQRPIVDEQVSGARRKLPPLPRGRWVAWRVTRDGCGFVSRFRVSRYAVGF